jgi:hypothetical protein
MCGCGGGVQGVLWAHTPGGKTARQRADVKGMVMVWMVGRRDLVLIGKRG